MEIFGDFLRENIQDLKPRVEDTLEVKLGEIDVRPFPQIAKDIQDAVYGDSSKFKRLSFGIIGNLGARFVEHYTLAMSMDSSIYYTRSGKIVRNLTETDMTQTGIHELVHLGHWTLAGLPAYQRNNVPKMIKEGFAEYITAIIMNEMDKPFLHHPNHPYLKYFNQFKDEISSRGISDINGVKRYVMSFS